MTMAVNVSAMEFGDDGFLDGLFAVAAIFTPPDAISMMSLAVPLVLLYEISILSVVMIERGKAREDAERAAKDLTPAA